MPTEGRPGAGRRAVGRASGRAGVFAGLLRAGAGCRASAVSLPGVRVRLSIRCVVAPRAGPALSGSVLGCGERRPERGAARMNVSTISASPFRMIASARRRSRPARSRQLRLLIGRGLRSPTACSSGVTVRPAWPAAVCAPCHVSAATRGADTSSRLLSTNPRSRDHTLCRPVPAGPCCATLA